ncbi:hypothetical protein GOODEAATRI_003185 [Goodea atripinnis]|uniref:Uncharacterized protein n=1 Tax=Goodea atripinnis TaxID=208336 RepID=A0ABV0N7N8_9TELE
MWHLWQPNGVEGDRYGPEGTMEVCLGDGRERVKNQIVKDISTLAPWPFLESEKIGGGGGIEWEGNQEFPQHTVLLHSVTSHCSPIKTQCTTPPSSSPSPCLRIPPQLPLRSPRTSSRH